MSDVTNFREVKYSNDYPALSEEELGRFLHELANMRNIFPTECRGEVSLGTNYENVFGRTIILGWTVNGWDFSQVAKRDLIPEPEFVTFINKLFKTLKESGFL